MTAPAAVRFALHGARVEASSDDAALLAPLAAAFPGGDASSRLAVPDIAARLGGPPPEWPGAARWSSPADASSAAAAVEVTLSLGADRLLAHARPLAPRSLLARLRNWCRPHPLNGVRPLFDVGVAFPVFWWLARTRGFRLLHATGLEARGRGLLLGGLDGAAPAIDGWRCFSRRFVLHDGESAAAVPDLAGGAPTASCGVAEAPVHAAVIVVLGDEPRLEPLAPDAAARALRAEDDLAPETRAFRDFSAVMDAAFPDAPPLETEDPLPRLLAGASCHRLVVGRSESPRAIAERLAAAARR